MLSHKALFGSAVATRATPKVSTKLGGCIQANSYNKSCIRPHNAYSLPSAFAMSHLDLGGVPRTSDPFCCIHDVDVAACRAAGGSFTK